MPPNNKALDLPIAAAMQVVGLDGAKIGSANDRVARFSAAVSTAQLGDLPLLEWLTRTDSATSGSTFKLRRTGLYLVSAAVGLTTGVADAKAAITLDGTNLAVDFSEFDAETLDFADAITPAAARATIKLAAICPIDRAKASGAATGVVRLQLGSTGGAAPTVAQIREARISIIRFADWLTGS